MKSIITGFAFFCILQADTSQTTATWMGGTPGKTSDWNCATNWKEGRIPDENTQVIVPSDLIFYPVIMSDVQDIDALLVAGGAKLTIHNGASLKVLGATHRLDRITVLGKIEIEGKLWVESKEISTSDQLALLHGNGVAHP